MSTKIIHRFWAGPKEIPEDYAEFGFMWDKMNPDWEIKMWTEEDIKEFPTLGKVFNDFYRRDEGRQGIELYVQMADVMGYALVHKFGGMYVNCDIEPIRPLPELPKKAWASYENDINDVVNAVIGAPAPRNVFWGRLLSKLPARYFLNPTDEMVHTTGPGLLTDMARRLPERIHVFPKETFNPVHWSKISPGGDAKSFRDSLPPETIGVHHWGHKKDGRTNYIESATQPK